MEYTEYGLKITLDELRKMLERAEAEHAHGNMEGCVYIKGGEEPKITQYCCYAECNSLDHTYGAKRRKGART